MEAVINAVIFSIANPFRPVRRFGRRMFFHIHDHFIPHARNNYHPHILGHRSLALSSILLVSVKICSIALLAVGPVLPAFSSAITPDNILKLTNQSRLENKTPQLTYNDVLAKAAVAKAKALVACSCFQHNLPDGRTPWDFIKAEKYNYIVAGENLAVDFSEAENVESAWMNSPGHRANILNKNFEQIGIGIAQGQFNGHMSTFVVQMFGTPISQPIANLNQPTVVAQNQPNPVPVPLPAPKAEVKPAPAPAPAPKLVRLPSTSPKQLAQAPASPSSPQAESSAPASPILPVAIIDGSVNIENNLAHVSVAAQGQVTKVLANFGGQAVMLEPKSDGTWQAFIDLRKLTDANKTVSVTAYDISGNSAGRVLAGFSDNVVSNYNITAAPDKPSTVSIFGWNVNPKAIEYRFYLIFAATILTCLVLAIAIRRHIQHISLVANTSFVAIFAMFLWLAG